MSAKRIALEIDGLREIHAAASNNGNYATLCGLDGDDPGIGQQSGGTARPGEKINCHQCIGVWLAAKPYQTSSFDPSCLKAVKGER